MSERSETDKGGGGSPPILDPLAGWCGPCLALCLHAMEQFFLNNICWKLFVSLTVTCKLKLLQ